MAASRSWARYDRLDLVPERDHAVQRRQVAGDRPEQRRLAGPVGPHDADPLPALGGEERNPGHGHGVGGVGAVRVERPAARQVAHGEVLEPDHELAGTDGAAGHRPTVEPQRAGRLPRCVRLLVAEPLEARLVLVHLGVLALAAITLDQLDLALDLLRLRLRLLLGAEVPLDALAVVGRVVAAEDGQPAVAQLPDAGHGRVEERPVVGGDQEGARPSPEVLLQPLDRPDVEVVGGLVEHQEVGVGDDETGEGGPGLLAARDRRRRPEPFVAGEPESGQGLVDALVERVPAQDLESVLQVRVVAAGGMAVVLQALELGGHALEVGGPVADRGPQVGSRHEGLVEVGLLAQQAE